MHTWPERGYVSIDVFMCGEQRPEAALDVMRRALAPTRERVRTVQRGIEAEAIETPSPPPRPAPAQPRPESAGVRLRASGVRRAGERVAAGGRFQVSSRDIRPMRPDDVEAVVAIITDVEEEDGEAAAADFAEEGGRGSFRAHPRRRGHAARRVRVSPCAGDRAHLLAVVDLSRRGVPGAGARLSALVAHVVETLREAGCRKAFVKVSDYHDPDEGDVYAAARKVYERLGFVEELRAADFYDEGENLSILGRGFGDEDAAETPEIADEKADIEFVGFQEIGDSDGAYTFEWAAPKRSLFGRRVGQKSGGFDRDDLVLGLESVRREGGRRVFLTFPSNLPSIHEPLREAGFEKVGQLTDYYEPGLHELHFVHDLSGIA